MEFLPNKDAFTRGYERGENQVVYTRLVADLDTPVSLMLKLAGAGANSFMLESVTGGETRGTCRKTCPRSAPGCSVIWAMT